MVTKIHNVTLEMQHVSCYADNGYGEEIYFYLEGHIHILFMQTSTLYLQNQTKVTSVSIENRLPNIKAVTLK